MISFVVYHEPVGKARPRMTRTGHTYTPDKTVNYENLVRMEYQRQCEGQRFDGDARLHLFVGAFYGIPKRDSRKTVEDKLSGKIRPRKKPDIDNCIKVIADALNGLAYDDDSQIVSVNAAKWYGDVPRVVVGLWEVGE